MERLEVWQKVEWLFFKVVSEHEVKQFVEMCVVYWESVKHLSVVIFLILVLETTL